MTNFKQETLELIGSHKVDEYMFKFSRDWLCFTITTYKGKEEITWNGIQPSMLMYDKGYGTQCWKGCITFKDIEDWLERESYDGMEWWAWRNKPSFRKRD